VLIPALRSVPGAAVCKLDRVLADNGIFTTREDGDLHEVEIRGHESEAFGSGSTTECHGRKGGGASLPLTKLKLDEKKGAVKPPDD
jgi:hypothetical protein